MEGKVASSAHDAVDYFKPLEAKLEYLTLPQIEQVRQAFHLAHYAHDGQMRRSGEPYISHPVAVACILANMHIDQQSIMAAILHDVIEDTHVKKEQLVDAFGNDVAELVEGVTKLTQIKFESREEQQAANFRKMVLAMVRDIRVIMVKLADRLHNMRTLGALKPAKRRRIARETLEIYGPIANRLGINSFRIEFEDLGLEAMYPMRAKVLREAVKRSRGNRKEIMSTIEETICQRLEQEVIPAKVYGREKHLYSLYKKMHRKGVSFSDVMDVYAFRIIVDSVDTCYRVLGYIHNLYKPKPGRFKDYIATPKANGYQSLHTTLFGPYGVPLEVQIRTRDMHQMAEHGIAAHWLYKSQDEDEVKPGAPVQESARRWLRGLYEMQQRAGNSLEFIENVKIDLFPDDVFVFTPKGKIIELLNGSTPVDFAYAIHTDVGNACVACKIDRKLAPLSTPLINGSTVEIVTAPGVKPNPAWLNFVVTGKARSNIRHFLKTQRRAESIALGRRLLSKALDTLKSSLEDISQERIADIVTDARLKSFDHLLEEIGLGNRMALLVARQLLPEPSHLAETREPEEAKPLVIEGTEGLVVHYAKCCYPIPGDSIVGFVSRGKGVVVHTSQCSNMREEFREHPEKFISIKWEANTSGDYQVALRIEAINTRGVLAAIAATISDLGANIEKITSEERDARHSMVSLIVSVGNRDHLARIMRRLKKSQNIARIIRPR